MSISATNDATLALVDHLKTISTVTARFATDHIVMLLPKEAQIGDWLLVVQAGGRGPNRYYPMRYPRLDIRTYAKADYRAMEHALVVQQALMPVSRAVGFNTTRGARIATLAFEGDIIKQVDGNGWPYALQTVVLDMWQQVAA